MRGGGLCKIGQRKLQFRKIVSRENDQASNIDLDFYIILLSAEFNFQGITASKILDKRPQEQDSVTLKGYKLNKT